MLWRGQQGRRSGALHSPQLGPAANAETAPARQANVLSRICRTRSTKVGLQSAQLVLGVGMNSVCCAVQTVEDNTGVNVFLRGTQVAQMLPL